MAAGADGVTGMRASVLDEEGAGGEAVERA